MTTTATRLWNSLDLMAESPAVLAEWRLLAGDGYVFLEEYLTSTEKKSLDYPCTHTRPCGCRHEIITHANGKLAAACRCDPAECKSIALKVPDTLLYKIWMGGIADAVRLAFGLESPRDLFDRLQRTRDVYNVGEIGLKKHGAKLVCGCDHGALLTVIDELLGYPGGFFLLITPTAKYHNDVVREKLRRNGCDIIALSETLEFVDGMSFKLLQNIVPILAGIGKPGSAAARTDKIVQDIHQKMAAVETGFHDVKKEVVAWRTDYREVQSAKARLEKMQADGLMKFTAKVDGKSFHVLCGIIACGDVAKASRVLKMGDSTVRDVIRSWKKLGPSYAVMTDLVRWRKRVGGKYTVPFNDKLLYEKDATAAGNETVFSDLLDAVLSMTESNWPDICAELESTLKKQLAK